MFAWRRWHLHAPHVEGTPREFADRTEVDPRVRVPISSHRIDTPHIPGFNNGVRNSSTGSLTPDKSCLVSAPSIDQSIPLLSSIPFFRSLIDRFVLQMKKTPPLFSEASTLSEVLTFDWLSRRCRCRFRKWETRGSPPAKDRIYGTRSVIDASRKTDITKTRINTAVVTVDSPMTFLLRHFTVVALFGFA